MLFFRPRQKNWILINTTSNFNARETGSVGTYLKEANLRLMFMKMCTANLTPHKDADTYL